ncbi:MAG: 23S rRNA (guanosine(2251)-2'-O)-methyltransferase RlmB, partial [Waddliaceae bacterium]
MGKNCLREVLRSDPKRLVEVYTCQKPNADSLYAELLKKNIPIRETPKKRLSQLVQSDSHQSYVAAVKEKKHLSLKGFFEQSAEMERSLAVMLDSIYDPQNLGSILRAAECFGVDLVVYSKNRGTDITPVVSKAGSGATEYVRTVKVSNLAETLKLFQENDYWVVCADAGEGSQSLYDFPFPNKTLLVLGSEGEGVQRILLRKSDFHINVPMFGNIDSLNVSQATAVFLSCYRKQYSGLDQPKSNE